MKSIAGAVARAIRELKEEALPAGTFDPSRYFRATGPLRFFNVRTPIVRAIGRQIAREQRDAWSLEEAIAFTERMLREPHLESKGVGIEALAVRRRELAARHLVVFKRWLADDLAANWATTDSLCGSLIAPLLLANPALVQSIRPWTRHRNFWVRRASAVSLVRHAARGAALDDVYDVATALQDDPADLIHKAVGWLLREAGRTDVGRLERYLLEHGASTPRTTVRYAIERFPAARRSALLTATRRQSSAPAHLNRPIVKSSRPLVKSSNRRILR